MRIRIPAIAGAHLLLAAFLALAGCTTTPTDVAPDGEVTNLDELDPEEQREARQTVFEGLNQGISQYTLVPGDQLEFMFHAKLDPVDQAYQIAVGDLLRVEFFYQPTVSRTVRVRPDGMITLPAKGDVLAAERTTDELAAAITRLFSDMFRDPVVSISVEEYNSAFDDLNSALTNIQGGRAQRVTVAPDGHIYLPLIPPIKAGGESVDEVRKQADQLYLDNDANITVSANLYSIVGNRVFVFGEVGQPGMLTLPQAQTAVQAITTAGGVLPTGSMTNVKVVYWTPEGESHIRTLNMNTLLTGENLAQDMLLPNNTVIYVPPTTITKMDRGVDQYIRQLFLFNGLNVTWLLNGENGLIN